MFKILNTRPKGQNTEQSVMLRAAGFDPVEIPLVEIVPHEEGLARVPGLSPAGYNGIFLSSPNGLRHFTGALTVEALRRWMQKPFFLVGGRARPWVKEAGGTVAFAPKEASLEGFLKEFPGVKGPGGMSMSQRWLHPCSAATRLDPAAFRAKSVVVENLPIYRPQIPGEAATLLREAAPGLSAVLLCSGSAVDHLFEAAPALAAALGRAPARFEEPSEADAGRPAVARAPAIAAVSIGPSTTQALRRRGVEVIHEAPSADDEGLLSALREAMGGAETMVLARKPKHVE